MSLSSVGLTSLAGSNTGLQIDTIAPSAPTQLALDSQHAASSSATPIITGLAEAGSTVVLYDTAQTGAIGTAVAGSNGVWEITTAVALPDASYNVYATATDAAGNVSTDSVALSVQIDTVAPGAPAFTVTNGTDGAATNDLPTLTGTAEAGSTVEIYDNGSTTALTSVVVGAQGTWQATTPVLSSGSNSLTATATDEAGNVSQASSAVTVLVPVSIPNTTTTAFSAQLADDTGSSASDGVTSDDALTGTAAANSIVTIANGSAVLGTTTADANGNWTYAPALADGAYTLTATGKDSQNNPQSVAVSVTLETAAPTVTVESELTNTGLPSVSGKATAGSTVALTLDGNVVDNVTANSSGVWTYTFQSDVASGDHLLGATATNAAGVSGTAASATLMVAPASTNGTTVINASAATLIASGSSNYQLQLSSGTETVQFLDATLNVGTDTQVAFVIRLYQGLLGRSPDGGGLSFWTNLLSGGLITEQQVAQNFLTSKEYMAAHAAGQTNTQFITALYQGLLDRAPTTTELSQDLAQLSSGGSRAALMTSVANSTESQQAMAPITSSVWVEDPDAQVVSFIYETALGRAADQQGLSFWTNMLQQGVTVTEMVQTFATTNEYLADHKGQTTGALINSLYENALGRQPTAAELNSLTSQMKAKTLNVGGLIASIAQSSQAFTYLTRPGSM